MRQIDIVSKYTNRPEDGIVETEFAATGSGPLPAALAGETYVASDILLVSETPEVKSTATHEDFADFDEAQTFIVSDDKVFGIQETTLSSVDLFFDMKPHREKNASGIKDPGVIVALAEVEEGKPRVDRVLRHSVCRLNYDDINVGSGKDVHTKVKLPKIKIKTNKHYAVIIKHEDPGFETCKNQIGVDEVGVGNVSDTTFDLPKEKSSGLSKGRHGGKFFKRTNDEIGGIKPVVDRDLKFRVNAVKTSANSDVREMTFVNSPHEFIKVKSSSANTPKFAKETITTNNRDFLGGEYVYQHADPIAGNISFTKGNTTVTGVGTSFDGLKSRNLVFRDDIGPRAGANAEFDVLAIDYVINSTAMVLAEPPSFTSGNAAVLDTVVGKVVDFNKQNKRLILSDTNATNSTFRFSQNSRIIGAMTGASVYIDDFEEIAVSEHVPMLDIRPGHSDIDVESEHVFVGRQSNGTYAVDNTQKTPFKNKERNQPKEYRPRILSRSVEAQHDFQGEGQEKSRSLTKKVKFKKRKTPTACTTVTSNTFVFPHVVTPPPIDPGDSTIPAPPIIINQYVIDLNYKLTVDTVGDRNYGLSVDTEVGNKGIAKSKHIAKKLTFANNRFAEDLKVYLTGYRPKLFAACCWDPQANTLPPSLNADIRVYAKLYNSQDPETFDDKAWTPLEITENANIFGDSQVEAYTEYVYSLPKYSETANALPGTFTTQVSNTVVAAVNVDPTTYLQNNDVIRIYSELFPDNYQVAVAATVNTTAIVLSQAISNNSMAGGGFKVDRVLYPEIAFNNAQNDNIVRYYSASRQEYDTYDSVQLKVVLLSPSVQVVPKVDAIQVVGVSA